MQKHTHMPSERAELRRRHHHCRLRPVAAVPGYPCFYQFEERSTHASVTMTSLHPRRPSRSGDLLRSFLKDENGSELLEFALSVSVLLMVVFGIMGFSLAVYAQ